MSSKNLKDEKKHAKNVMFSQKCLGIVLKRNQDTKSSESESSRLKNGELGNSASSATDSNAEDWMFESGYLIFQDFQEENRQCFWNPTLVESVNNVEFMGFVAPGTLLIGGNEFYLEGLRSCWARRVLKPPVNYIITRLGDVTGFDVQVIAQTQFTPLPEALCLVISELNQQEESASLQVICAQLNDRFSDMIVPNESIVYSTLGKLIKERKVYHTGDGYFIVTPKTYRLTTLSSLAERPLLMTTEEAMLKLHGSHLQPTPPPPMACRSRSIQANMDEATYNGKPHLASSSLSRMERFGSMRLSRREKKTSSIERRGSLSPERSKSLAKDINLKTSPAHNYTDKGEKVSVFHKLFRRSSSKRRKESKSPVKLATFSAQFPPTEWTNLSCVHFQSRATQTLEHRTLKDKMASTNSLKPKTDNVSHEKHQRARTVEGRTSTPRRSYPSSSTLERSPKKSSVQQELSKTSERKHRRAESCTLTNPKKASHQGENKIINNSKNDDEDEMQLVKYGSPPKNKVAPYRILPQTKDKDTQLMNNAQPTTAITTTNVITTPTSTSTTTIINKLSPSDEKNKIQSVVNTISPTSASEFDVTFSSLAAQKILKGLSITSIDTLVEVNMAAEKADAAEGGLKRDLGLGSWRKLSTKPSTYEESKKRLEDKNETKVLGIV